MDLHNNLEPGGGLKEAEWPLSITEGWASFEPLDSERGA